MRVLLRALCEALSANGIRIAVDRKGRCTAAPSDRLVPAMLGALKYYKPEIVRAARWMNTTEYFELVPCTRCGSDLVRNHGELCFWCYPLRKRRVEMPAQSRAEIAFLAQVEGYLKTLKDSGITVPNCPKEDKTTENTTSGTVGTDGTVARGYRTYARA